MRLHTAVCLGLLVAAAGRPTEAVQGVAGPAGCLPRGLPVLPCHVCRKRDWRWLGCKLPALSSRRQLAIAAAAAAPGSRRLCRPPVVCRQAPAAGQRCCIRLGQCSHCSNWCANRCLCALFNACCFTSLLSFVAFPSSTCCLLPLQALPLPLQPRRPPPLAVPQQLPRAPHLPRVSDHRPRLPPLPLHQRRLKARRLGYVEAQGHLEGVDFHAITLHSITLRLHRARCCTQLPRARPRPAGGASAQAAAQALASSFAASAAQSRATAAALARAFVLQPAQAAALEQVVTLVRRRAAPALRQGRPVDVLVSAVLPGCLADHGSQVRGMI